MKRRRRTWRFDPGTATVISDDHGTDRSVLLIPDPERGGYREREVEEPRRGLGFPAH